MEPPIAPRLRFHTRVRQNFVHIFETIGIGVAVLSFGFFALCFVIPGAYDTLKFDEGEFGVFWELRKLVVGNHAAAVNLEIVLCETLKLLPMSRIGSPAPRRLIASACW